VRRFAEKPALETAKEYLASGIITSGTRGCFSASFDDSRELKRTSRGDLCHTGNAGFANRHTKVRSADSQSLSKLEKHFCDYARSERARRFTVPKVFVIPAEVG